MRTARKRPQPVSSSSDINSSGLPLSKRPIKRVRIDSPGDASASSTRILAEKSKNLLSPPKKPDFKGCVPPEPPTSSALHFKHIDAVSSLRDDDLHKLKLAVIAELADLHLYDARDPDNLLSTWKDSTDISLLLSRKGWWTPHFLDLFSTQSISELSLSTSFTSHIDPCIYLVKFFKQGIFTQLRSLSLDRVPLSHTSISHLRLLPALESLDLASTGISSLHLCHLVVHAPTLRTLNISENPAISDDARVPLSALTKLGAVHLRGTSVTMPGLRHLVHAIPSDCRLVTIPRGCLDYLNSRPSRYCQSVPAGYVVDPRQVPDLPLAALKKNLELHKKANKDIQLVGNKVDMVDRLMNILCGRLADNRIVQRLGKRQQPIG